MKKPLEDLVYAESLKKRAALREKFAKAAEEQKREKNKLFCLKRRAVEIMKEERELKKSLSGYY